MHERKIARVGGIGILTARDWDALGTLQREVLSMMSDGSWYTRGMICSVGGAEGLRRYRELKRHYHTEKRRVSDSREWEYRLVRKKENDNNGQGRLFS